MTSNGNTVEPRTKIKADVNFSDRTTKRTDPHQWAELEAELVVRGRIVNRPRVFLCVRCDLLSMVSPQFIHNDELGICKPAEAMEAVEL